MAYIVKDDILKQLALEDLIGLTDDANSGSVDDAIVSAAISNSEGEADGYLAVRYKTPVSPVPVIIQALVVDLAIYRLYGRRKGIPEDVEKRRDDAIKFLRDVSRGLVELGVDTPSPENSGAQVDLESDTRIFTNDSMSGF